MLGGALLGATAGGERRDSKEGRGPTSRVTIRQDQEILERIPPEETELRAGLERSMAMQERLREK